MDFTDNHRSLSSLTTAFTNAPDPELDHIVGDLAATFIGPLWVRAPGPTLMAITGMPHWYGKRIRPGGGATRDAVNLVGRPGALREAVPMTAQLRPSRVDNRPAVALTYAASARFPWHRVTDELRQVQDEVWLGLTFGIPGAPRSGAPFLLRAAAA